MILGLLWIHFDPDQHKAVTVGECELIINFKKTSSQLTKIDCLKRNDLRQLRLVYRETTPKMLSTQRAVWGKQILKRGVKDSQKVKNLRMHHG